jgi:hypothetical protein
MEVNFEALLQRSNYAKSFIESDIEVLNAELINWKESPKKWSVLEVVSHLNQVYKVYLENFEKTISDAPELKDDHTLRRQSTILGRMSAYFMKPKGKKRKFKMKTFDFFEPVSNSKKPNDTIALFFENKNRFNEIIKSARLKDIKGLKIPTALGEKIKFYIPECIDFLLAHEERHLVQIEEILKRATSTLHSA